MAADKKLLSLPLLKQAIDTMDQKHSVMCLCEALTTLEVYVSNLIEHPKDKKYRKVTRSNIHFYERLGRYQGSQEAMNALGFVIDGDYYVWKDRQEEQFEDIIAQLKKLQEEIKSRSVAARKTLEGLPVRTDETHEFVSVLGCGGAGDLGKRPTMEDDHIVVDGFTGEKNCGFFGLYDGHGGRATVDFVVKAMHLVVEEIISRNPDKSICECMELAHLEVDGLLRRENILQSGTTTVTCVLTEEKGERTLHVANVGDSRAVLCRGGNAIRLTVDHKPNLPGELKRIQEAGGFVGRFNRVNGVLAISRAIGDHMLKHNDVVTARPYLNEIALCPEDKYLVLACDGVWDVLSDQEVCEFVHEHMDEVGPEVGKLERNERLLQCAKGIINLSLKKKTQDNVTVMCVQLTV